MNADFEESLPWVLTLILAPGIAGILLAVNGEPDWASLAFAIGSLAILFFSLPSVILYLRNPTGNRIESITSLGSPWNGWGRVFMRRQKLLNHCANKELWEQWYGPYHNYQAVSDEVLNWYGKDVYRVATVVAGLRRKHHDAATVLYLFSYTEVTDFDRMLDYLAAVEPEVALYALQYDVPLEYATAMALPTGTHD